MPTNILLSGGRLAFAASVALAAPFAAAVTVDFSDLSLAPSSYYNGSDGAGSFASGGASFGNSYNSAYGSWSGFAYSNVSDTTTVGYGNQYSSYAAANAGVYGVAYYPGPYGDAPTITFDSTISPQSIQFVNTTYVALDLLNGSGFSKKFGGETGNDADWLTVTLTGYDSSNAVTGAVTFYLADYRFSDNAFDYVVDEWTTVDITGLGTGVKSIQLSLDSSDVGMFGVNTPTYVALDNLVYSAVPEPSSAALLVGMGALAACGVRRRRSRDAA